jgi:hypothetical protein
LFTLSIPLLFHDTTSSTRLQALTCSIRQNISIISRFNWINNIIWFYFPFYSILISGKNYLF